MSNENNNITPEKRSAILVFSQTDNQDLHDHEEAIKYSAKQQHLEITKTIYTGFKPYETSIYKMLIDDIITSDRPVVIIDCQTHIFPENIMTSTILGTLEYMKLAKIYTYSTSYDRIECNLIKHYHPIITDATYQLRVIHRSLESTSKQERENKLKKDRDQNKEES